MGSVHQVDAVTPDESTNFAGMVGNSEAMRRVFALIRRVADSDATVLITGPTGSGKELVARALHAFSSRPNAIFLPFNCGAVVPSLAASELFGHARGAFTGAGEKRQGAFEVANGGTLFLDEIGELPLEVQPHLLRALEQNEICRVGESRPIPVDVRVIAATLRDLEAEVAAGRFREDLLYRINLVPIDLPPLNERPEDVPLLVGHFLAREAVRQDCERPPQILPETMAALMAHPWPGNVRELANVIRRAVVLAGPDGSIKPADLMLSTGAAKQAGAGRLPTLALAERELIGRALAQYPSRRAAAEALDIAVSTLYEKIKKYGLDDGGSE
jgi:two-component system response regulator HydG